MNNELRLGKAVELFRESDQTTEDYINFMMVVQNVTRQGSGLMWSHIKEIVENTLEPKNEWLRIFPTFEDYMFVVDSQLEILLGVGHTHLEDYNWYDAYDAEVLPSDVANEFYELARVNYNVE